MEMNLKKYLCICIYTYIYELVCCTPETLTQCHKSAICVSLSLSVVSNSFGPYWL